MLQSGKMTIIPEFGGNNQGKFEDLTRWGNDLIGPNGGREDLRHWGSGIIATVEGRGRIIGGGGEVSDRVQNWLIRRKSDAWIENKLAGMGVGEGELRVLGRCNGLLHTALDMAGDGYLGAEIRSERYAIRTIKDEEMLVAKIGRVETRINFALGIGNKVVDVKTNPTSMSSSEFKEAVSELAGLWLQPEICVRLETENGFTEKMTAIGGDWGLSGDGASLSQSCPEDLKNRRSGIFPNINDGIRRN